ncbi:MAG: DegT/DnrJ/EryC1/StrS family aminotransferase [Endomicrobia bacterium]|nr:DegT/DnrJ/EryC1/StrS family aminotransferase [Endomicrobiia bacterium]MDW8055335.1 DegT/DnrJ/EryC1/StrS family aminotransferase [Elusimicrobiota bacterium]
MRVPFIDINVSDNLAQDEIKKSVLSVIERKEFILGEEVKKFEEEFAKFVGCRYAIGVSSGSTALLLSLRALGIKQGDYVVTTPFTFTATAESVIHTGATVVFVDIDENTYNISVEAIKKCIEKYRGKIKAVLPVHLYGQPCEMDSIKTLCEKNNIKIIEDAAQAHGALLFFQIRKESKQRKDIIKKVGAIGDVGCFSFYPTKNLGCYGDGGAITTNNEELYQKLLRLRNHGRVEHYLYQHIGYNARLDNLQAAVLLIKLKYLDRWNKERQKIAKIYNEGLSNVGDIITPYVSENVTHVYHLYVIRTKYRDELMKYLNLNKIGCAVQYGVPLHLQPAYKGLYKTVDSLKTTEKIAKEVLSLPIYPGLELSKVEYVIKTIKKFFKTRIGRSKK